MARPKISYASRMEKIRPFVTFDFKRPDRVKPSNKRKISIYYNWFTKPGKGFIDSHGRPRFKTVDVPKKSLEKARHDVNREFEKIKGLGRTQFSSLFVEFNSADEIHYNKKLRKWTLTEPGPQGTKTESYEVPIEDKEAFALDPLGYLKRLIKHVVGQRYAFKNPTAPWWTYGGRSASLETLIEDFRGVEVDSGGEFKDFVSSVIVYV